MPAAVRRLLAVLAGLALLLVPPPAAPRATLHDAATLTVLVENVRNDLGRVRVAIWGSAEGFADKDRILGELTSPAAAGTLQVSFEGLAPGRYALASFHDENDNNRLDRTWIGLPSEGLGFSNGAWIKLGPPAFDEAAVEVAAGRQSIVISLRY